MTILLLASATAILFVSCSGTGQPTDGSDSTHPKPPDDSGKVQTTLSSVLPYDVSLPPQNERVLETTVRRGFDNFSWHSFIALCWNPEGGLIGEHGDNATVWETWKYNYEVFLDSGQKPSPWNQLLVKKDKSLFQTGKTPPDMRAIFQPFLTGPLIDQNGQYARFEIAINKEMFEYIDNNTLYNIEGQRKFKDTLRFPSGDSAKKTYGAIMVKAAWKILGKGDDSTKFHRRMATIHTPVTTAQGTRDSTYEALVGLVGLHIGTKTEVSPQWIWSTFEHVDNVPDYGKAVAGKQYNFYNIAAGEKRLNQVPSQPWNPGKPGQTPSQIARLTPIDSGTQALNDSIRALLVAINPKSVWQYYTLVGTQWPVHPSASDTGDPFPLYMANCTLETYDQGSIQGGKIVYTPNVTSSCINCHNGATTWGGAPSDFTFILKTAKAEKK
ncbi:hypothetical protein SAMN05421788_11741 [Filimonas lacunae]|uniref:Cytochrome P460 n=1 Tax=Filimonas lacunae TaxID=477680 RepID=A0A1N7RHD9_9BACT|nr:hypothetical protein [Filimonas lacunae]SIT34570.1 hypothetical protein SAMN05421788_11741 [Filimonas lacunae]